MFPLIPQTSEYALRAVVHLARIGGGPAVTEDIAEATVVPAGYLARVLRSLSRAGLLTAQRGVGGGFALAVPAGKITVWDVFLASGAEFARFEQCPLGLSEHGSELCTLHALLEEATSTVETMFRRVTIQDVLTSGRKTPPLCTPRTPTGLSINRDTS